MTPTVDVHAHALVPAAEAAAGGPTGLARQRELDLRGSGAESAAVNQAQLARIGPLLTDPARRLAAMDDAASTSRSSARCRSTTTGPTPSLAERITRITNDGIAAVVAERPDRLPAAGHRRRCSTPISRRSELTRAVTDARAARRPDRHRRRAGGTGRRRTRRVWTRAAELRAVVFIHPWGCSLGERLDRYYLSNTVGNPVETDGRAVAHRVLRAAGPPPRGAHHRRPRRRLPAHLPRSRRPRLAGAARGPPLRGTTQQLPPPDVVRLPRLHRDRHCATWPRPSAPTGCPRLRLPLRHGRRQPG